MSNRMSRRSIIASSIGISAGAIIPVGLANPAAAEAEVTRSGSRIAEVREQVGDQVTVAVIAKEAGAAAEKATLPMAGFPSGWRLDEHDQVIVTRPDAAINPSTVMPLVMHVEGRLDRASGTIVSIAGKKMRLREETLQTWAASDHTTYEAWCIPNDRKSVLSCVALRPT